MKKQLVTVAVVCTSFGVLLGLCLGGASPVVLAGGGQGGAVPVCASQNGDVDGDGEVALTDAVTILGYLFLGNPTDLLPLCATQGSCGLPDTGQTKCYNASGAKVPCDSTTCPGQDGFYATGCPSEGRFVDNQDGTVTDHCTGLMWQQNTADVNGDGQTPEDGSDALLWCAALAYCENLSFAGHDDWRLPNVRELQSIVDYERFDPSIDPVFGALRKAVYWSSTSNADLSGYAWRVAFHGGYVYSSGDKDVSFYVRAVRSGP